MKSLNHPGAIWNETGRAC